MPLSLPTTSSATSSSAMLAGMDGQEVCGSFRSLDRHLFRSVHNSTHSILCNVLHLTDIRTTTSVNIIWLDTDGLGTWIAAKTTSGHSRTWVWHLKTPLTLYWTCERDRTLRTTANARSPREQRRKKLNSSRMWSVSRSRSRSSDRASGHPCLPDTRIRYNSSHLAGLRNRTTQTRINYSKCM